MDTRAEPPLAPPGPLKDVEEKLALGHLEAMAAAAQTQVTDLGGQTPPVQEAAPHPGFISLPQWALVSTKCFFLIKVNTTFYQNPSLTCY